MRPIPIQAIELIKKWEGFRPKPYLCPSGIPTIGYGTTYYPDTDVPVSLTDAPISEEDASKYLALSLVSPMKRIVQIVNRNLSDHELAALLSFVYNVGFSALMRSTLLKVLNGADGSLETEWLKWNKSAGKPLAGLTKRRQEEFDLFTKPSMASTDLLPEVPSEEHINDILGKLESKLT